MKSARDLRQPAPHNPTARGSSTLGNFCPEVELTHSLVGRHQQRPMWGLHVFADRPAPGSPEVFRLVAALELGFMVPALATGGVLLWSRQALGYALSALAAIQATLYLFVLSVNSGLAIHRELAQWPGELPIWAPLCVATGACVFWLMRSVAPARQAPNAA